MSKKSRDSSTLFELISQAGGRVKGVTPPTHTDSAEAPPDETPPAEPPAPPLPEPPPLPELTDLPEQSAPAPAPAAPEPTEQKAESPAEDKPADTADERPAEQAETSTRTEAQAAPAARPKPKAKKKAAPKRATKGAAKAPARAGARTTAKKRTSAAAGAGASAKKPSAKDDETPAEKPVDVQAPPPAEEPLRPMPAGFAPPAHLRPKAHPAPCPAVGQSITPVPPVPLIAAAVAIALMIVTFVVGFIAGRASAPRDAVDQDGQTDVASVNTGQPDGGQPGPSGRIDGMHYLIIQELVGGTAQDRADAFDIQSFCEGNGCPADVRRYTREDGKIVYAVVSFDPFELPGSPEAKAFALKIEELGRQYEAQGGNYRFQQRPSRTAELRPRYEPWRESPQE